MDNYANKNDLSKEERATYESLRGNMLTSSTVSATQVVTYAEKSSKCDVRMDAFHTGSDDENNGMTTIVDDDVPIVRTTTGFAGHREIPIPSAQPESRKRSLDATRCRYTEIEGDSQFIPDVGDYDVNDGWMIDDTTPPSSPIKSLYFFYIS